MVDKDIRAPRLPKYIHRAILISAIAIIAVIVFIIQALLGENPGIAGAIGVLCCIIGLVNVVLGWRYAIKTVSKTRSEQGKSNSLPKE